METPTFATLMNTIISVHGADDEAWMLYWSDVRDGRAWRALLEFWTVLAARRPDGTVREVVAAWSRDELQATYDGIVWRKS